MVVNSQMKHMLTRFLGLIHNMLGFFSNTANINSRPNEHDPYISNVTTSLQQPKVRMMKSISTLAFFLWFDLQPLLSLTQRLQQVEAMWLAWGSATKHSFLWMPRIWCYGTMSIVICSVVIHYGHDQSVNKSIWNHLYINIIDWLIYELLWESSW